MRILARRPHINGCFMTRDGRQMSPWCLDSKWPQVYADKNGNATGQTHSWIRVRCNDPECTALVLVHQWDLMDLIHEALR